MSVQVRKKGAKYSKTLNYKIMTLDEELQIWKDRAELAEQTLESVLQSEKNTKHALIFVAVCGGAVGILLGFTVGVLI